MLIEVCAGSLEDCLTAQEAGADRIELNSALHLGGLTPSLATLKLAKERVKLPIICMVRPRGAGFCYSEVEKDVMRLDARLLLEAGADGLACGALTAQGLLDRPFIAELIAMAHRFGADFVFHRAIDVAKDPFDIAEQLIDLGCDRILTSGQAVTAPEGVARLAQLQIRYGRQIELCMGSGIAADNVQQLYEATGIGQVHASFKAWQEDPTSSGQAVDYSYGLPGAYDYVSKDKILALKEALSIEAFSAGLSAQGVLSYERFSRFLLVVDCCFLLVELVAIGLVGVVGVGMVVRAIELSDGKLFLICLGLILLAVVGLAAWLFRLKTYREAWRKRP